MRRERFVEELESYSKQLEEFQTFGDMQEIQRYLKKAQALNQRLESASEKVDITDFVTSVMCLCQLYWIQNKINLLVSHTFCQN